ncbi:MAG: ankyrin repeat domain-containing protein [Puniceicoccales bacterium]|jgi:cytohesin|nr:ankyrin repeat domain-containing protein [Puniceicoccales bacterium]
MDRKKLFRNVVLMGWLLGHFVTAEAYLRDPEEISDSLFRSISTKSLKEYLDEGGDANESIFKTPLLICAVNHGRYDLVRFLLERKVDPNVVGDQRRDTPLGDAVRKGDYKIVRLLLRYGADPNKESGLYTPLVHAVHHCCWGKLRAGLAIIELLLENGADPNPDPERTFELPLHAAACGGASLEVFKTLIDGGADMEGKNRDGDTPLHEAAWNGNCLQVQELIDGRVDVNAPNKHGETPLDYAFSGRNRINKEIHEKGFRSPLLKAWVQREYTATISYLRSKGARVGSNSESEDSSESETKRK